MAVNKFVHRLDIHNPGDYWSSPARWLGEQLPGEVLDYKQLAGQRDQVIDRLIVGGGGFGQKFISCIEVFLANNHVNHTVIWGTAWELNREDLDQFAAKCTLVGVREWFEPSIPLIHWTPCASVLHSRLARIARGKPQSDWLIVDHWKRKKIQFPLQHTRITNYGHTMDQILAAIAGHRWVLTSSYHVVYWSILLNRRVIYISNPWLPTVDHMRWSVPCAEVFAWRLLDETRTYPDALEQARCANRDFLAKIQQL